MKISLAVIVFIEVRNVLQSYTNLSRMLKDSFPFPFSLQSKVKKKAKKEKKNEEK